MASRNRGLTFGVGTNDADYVVSTVVNGKHKTCLLFRVWKGMLQRCYSAKCQELRPTYIGCSVVEEWHSFMTFREWMIAQDWEGKDLDKDLIIEGNKVYGPDTCVFVDRKTNSLLTNRAACRGGLPIGVRRNLKGYQAHCCIDGKDQSLGTFRTPDQAHLTYLACKAEVVMVAALRQPDIRVKSALFLRSLHMAYRSEQVYIT